MQNYEIDNERRLRDIVVITDDVYFPFVYTLITTIVIFGGSLMVLHLMGESSSWARIISTVLFILATIWIYWVEIIFGVDYIAGREKGVDSLFEFADIFICVTLVTSGIWYTIYIYDETQFIDVPVGGPYRQFVTFWYCSVLSFGTVGFTKMIPVGVVAELWGILTIFNVIWWILVVLGRAATNKTHLLLKQYKQDDKLSTMAGERVSGGNKYKIRFDDTYTTPLVYVPNSKNE